MNIHFSVYIQFHLKASLSLKRIECGTWLIECNPLKGVFKKTFLIIHQQAHVQVGKHLYLSCDSQVTEHYYSRKVTEHYYSRMTFISIL